MLENIIGQQQAFLTDYRKAASEKKETDEEILERVISYLNLSGKTKFTLAGKETKSGKPTLFSFEKQLKSRDYDGSITAEYTYANEPFEVDDHLDEQQEW